MVEIRELVAAAHRLQTKWTADGEKFCFIGGLAIQRWGEPRYTRDIDATVFVGFGGERDGIKRLLCQLNPRIKDAPEFALINRVLLVEDSSGHPIDISLAAMPFEEAMIERSVLEELSPDVGAIRVCGASDLVILKVFAGRPQDWTDVRGILVRSGALIDWELVENELQILLSLKEELESLDHLRSLRASLKR